MGARLEVLGNGGRTALAFALLFALPALAIALGDADAESYAPAANAVWIFCSLLALIAVAVAARSGPRGLRPIFGALTVALALELASNLGALRYTLDGEPLPSPFSVSTAILLLAAAPYLYAGLLTMRTLRIGRATWLELGLVAVAATTVAAVALLPAALDSGGEGADRAVAILGLALAVALAVPPAVTLLSGSPLSQPLRLVAIALLFNAVALLAVAYAALRDSWDSLFSAPLVDANGPLFYGLLAAAAVRALAQGSAATVVSRRHGSPLGARIVLAALLVAFPVAYELTDVHPRAGVALAAQVLLGALLACSLLFASRAERTLAAEPTLRRVATAVAETTDPADVFEIVAVEAACLVGAETAAVLRLDSLDAAVVVGSHTADGYRETPIGQRIRLVGSSVVRTVALEGRAARVADAADERYPYAQRVAAPVRVDGKIWGAVCAVSNASDALAGDAEDRLQALADLVAVALANASARAALVEQATTDPLTGLANYRAFHDRLRSEAIRAQRRGDELALVVFDLDGFKEINDAHGHQEADRVLARVAALMAGRVREGELAARLGGDEFALLMPHADAHKALVAAERIRRVVADERLGRVGALTLSAGVCDLATAGSTEALVRLADGALYWSKAHGRDTAVAYSPDVVHELSADERARQLERERVLAGVTALARAVDAKDPMTSRHSERVAEMAVRLARQLGWGEEDIARLEQAGLVHDVGKIAVPDAILRKPGRLTAEEYEQVKTHAEIGASMVVGVLDDQQVLWIRHHHERYDALGYPDGIGGDLLSAGARLLALADAWDAMTVARPYGAPLTTERALAECLRASGGQFCPDAVAALVDALGLGVPAEAVYT